MKKIILLLTAMFLFGCSHPHEGDITIDYIVAGKHEVHTDGEDRLIVKVIVPTHIEVYEMIYVTKIVFDAHPAHEHVVVVFTSPEYDKDGNITLKVIHSQKENRVVKVPVLERKVK